ncbi:MAG TPA: response regulator, partial [Candidatus Sumerlaeota bacterium]|nr:response regulator [Candidatus Sumerlaeota bacterium]
MKRIILDYGLDLELTTAHDGDEAILHLQNRPYDLVVCDQNMPEGEAQGMDVLRYTQEMKPQAPLFILVTGVGTIDMAVQAMRLGAYDFLEKPFQKEKFINYVRNALGALELAQENRTLRQAVEAHYVFAGIIAVSKVLRDVLELARRAAEKNSAV